MHELSIAISMVEMATTELERNGGEQVSAVYLKLGKLAGVVKEALLFSYEVACQGTPLAGSRLVIEELPVVIYCQVCQQQQTLVCVQEFSCPVCNTATMDIVQGRELEIFALEITT